MGALQVASLFGVLDLRDNLTPGLQKASGGLKSFGSGLSSAGSKVTKFGAQMGLISGPLLLLGKQSLSVAADFDSAMAMISARTGVVGEDLEMISQFALQMGADTVFSAQEAADAFLELLAAGQSTEEAIATLPAVLDMAAASGIGLGESAGYVTSILAAYGLEASDAVEVTDALARAAGASRADITSLGDGFANVGPIARQFGLDVEETAAVLAILANNGMAGAEAGTALKSMLIQMTRTTDETTAAWDELGTSFYDAEGNARPLGEVLAEIKTAMAEMPAEEQNRLMMALAGSYGAVALSALLGDVSISDMEQSMSEQASAAEVAAKNMDTFAGATDSLKGSFETLQIEAMTPFMNETLKPLFVDMTGVINKMAEWAAANPELTQQILMLSAAFIAVSAGALILGPIMGFLGGGVTLLAGAFGLLLSPLGLLGLFLLAAYTNFGGLGDAIEQVRTSIEEGDIVGLLDGIVDALAAIPLGIATWIGALVGIDVPAGLSALAGVFDQIGIILSALPGAIGAFITALSKLSVPQALKDIADFIQNIVDGIATITGFGGGPGVTPDMEQAAIGAGIIPSHDFPGSYSAGKPYMVGTGAQPELWVPGESGTAYPAGSYGGGAGGGINMQGATIILQGVQDPDGLLDKLEVAARRRNRRVTVPA